MTKKDDGGPAFPIVTTETNEHGLIFPFVTPGMTLRDYFAAQALTEFASFISVNLAEETVKVVARISYQMADAMLAEREK